MTSAESDISAELERSDNPWLACYVTRLTALRSTLELSPLKEDATFHGRLDVLMTKKDEVLERHGWNPPQIIRDELIKGIQNLLEL